MVIALVGFANNVYFFKFIVRQELLELQAILLSTALVGVVLLAPGR